VPPRAFLQPALSRPNLTVLLRDQRRETELQRTRCVGVTINTDGAVKFVGADREVILAAGAIGSPKLLMLSGVGEAKALRGLGIDVVENLPGVGENLQDHVLVSGVIFKYKGKMPDRPADSNAVEAEAYLSSGPSADTDINLVLEQLPIVTPETAARFGTPPADAFTIAPALVQPTSRGSVRLASNNFHDAAVIDGNYLGTDSDFAAIVRAIETARELGISRLTACARPNCSWAEGLRRSGACPTCFGELGHAVAPARWAWISSPLSIQRCACTVLRGCAWSTRPSCRESLQGQRMRRLI
jgi:choline dehydrogenase